MDIYNFKDFQIYQVAPDSFELFGLFMRLETDLLQGSFYKKEYSLNLLVTSEHPLPNGRYRIVLSLVNPKRHRITGWDAQGNIIHQDPEYSIEETWIGEMKVH